MGLCERVTVCIRRLIRRAMRSAAAADTWLEGSNVQEGTPENLNRRDGITTLVVLLGMWM